MIQLSNIKKFFGTQILFENVTFSINSGERIGLVGRNGTGKSSLLKIIQGELIPDSGEMRIPKGYRIGSLNQHLNFTKSNLLEECSQELKGEEKYDFFRVEKILFGLGFNQEDLKKSPKSFSGGYQIRIELTKMLLKKPDLLLLDEPTNYLDIISLRWIKSFIREFPGEVILITHDRDFMDSCINQVMGITQRNIKKIKGSTKNYYERIEQDQKIEEKTKENELKKKEHLESFINRFKAKASKAKQAQSKMKQLDKLEISENGNVDENFGFKFPYKECPSKNFLKVEDLQFSYEDGPKVIDNFNLMVRKGDRIAIIGKNGKGKSTLLNLLSEELTPSKGQLLPHLSLERGHFGQTNIKRLNESNTIVDEIYSSNSDLSQSRVRGICGTMMFSDDLAKKKISILSGGEKSRVLLGKILATPTNLLLLDEPTNHLDMESVDVLIDQINQFSGASLIVTHNEKLLRQFAKKLIVFHKGEIEIFDGTYDEFLEKIGWEEERANGSNLDNNKKSSWKNLKKLRAEIIKERSKILGPLKKESEKIEEEICNLEELLEEKNSEIIALSSGGEGKRISFLSKEVNELETKVEESFSRLEELSELIEKYTHEFEGQLDEIGS
jgi:ATP-binding cassette subfamily F protein 3